MPANTPTNILLDRARGGDAASLEELFQRHLPGLRAFVRLRTDPALRERESSSDLVQSVCREVLENLDSYEYRGEGSFRNWLYTWALNKIRNRARHWQRQKRDPNREVAAAHEIAGAGDLLETYASFCTPSHHATVRERVAHLERAMDRIPENYRDIIIEARIVGLTSAEIARQTGRSEAAVRQLLRRATVRLATELDRPS